METGESFWVSGVKKNGEDRHWAGSGKVLVEAAALADYLKAIGAKTLDSYHSPIGSFIDEGGLVPNTGGDPFGEFRFINDCP